jgi:hypothetical protein
MGFQNLTVSGHGIFHKVVTGDGFRMMRFWEQMEKSCHPSCERSPLDGKLN